MKRRIRPEIQEWIDAGLAVFWMFCLGLGCGAGMAAALAVIDWVIS